MTQYLPFLGTSFDDASDDDRKSRSELLVEIQIQDPSRSAR